MGLDRKTRGIKKQLKKFVNFSYWMNKDYLVNTAIDIKESVKQIFVVSAPKRVETFSEALKRLNIKEETLEDRKKEFKRLYRVFLILAALLGLYFCYSIWNGYVIASVISACLVGYAIAMAFKFHFWFFQISQRRLGCTFKEWFNIGVRGKK